MRCRGGPFQCAMVADAAGLRADSWTIEACVRIHSQPATDTQYNFVAKGAGGNSDLDYRLAYWNDGGTYKLVAACTCDGGNQSLASAYTLIPGRWYALGGTCASAGGGTVTFKLYAAKRADIQGNGADASYTEVDTDDISDDATSGLTGDLYLGCEDDNGTLKKGANCDLAEVAIYDTARTLSTVPTTRLTGSESNLIAYYRCDEGTGSTLYDRTGSGFDMTLQNSAQWAGQPNDLLYDTGVVSRSVVCVDNAVWRAEASVVASEAATGYADERLLCARQAVAWRSSDVSGAKTVTVDCGRPVAVQLVSVEGHNLTSKATVTLEGDDESGFTSPPVDETLTYHPARLRHFLARPYSYQHWRFSFTDAANGDGYVSIGALCLWVWPWESDIEATGISVPLTDASVAVVPPHGHPTVRSATKSSGLAISWPSLPFAQAEELRRRFDDAQGLPYALVIHDPQRNLYSRDAYGPIVEVPGYAPGDPSLTYGSAQGLVMERDF